MGGKKSCSSKNSFKISWSRSNDNNCHVLSSPLSFPCPLRNTCPILGRLSRCGWSETNALKPFADTELMTAITVLSNGMTEHNKLSQKFRTLRFLLRSTF